MTNNGNKFEKETITEEKRMMQKNHKELSNKIIQNMIS